MHYYQFNIGDYASHTRYLTPMQDLSYRRLLDLYYLHEKPIPEENPSAYIGLNDCSTDVQRVLNEYFVLTSKGWVNKRADEQIAEYHNKQKSASLAGKKSAEARKANKDKPIEQAFNDRSTDVQPTINHKPLTNNHKPIKIKEAPEGVSPQTWSDFLLLRKEKRSPVTETVIKGIRKEAEKVCLTLQEAIEHCCVSGWQSFKAEWYENNKVKKQDKVYESPWQKAARLRMAEFAPDVAAKDPNEANTIDMEFFSTPQGVKNVLTNGSN